MNPAGKKSFAAGRYRSQDLAIDLPQQLQSLTCSHRTFAARAAQELHRAERYRQYLSLIIFDTPPVETNTADQNRNPTDNPLIDFAAAVRAGCRISDLVSGVEREKFAVLLIETGTEGAQAFLARLKELQRVFFNGDGEQDGTTNVQLRQIHFPDGGSNSVSMTRVLNELYQQAQLRPHIS